MELRARWNGESLEPIAADLSWCNENLVIGMIHKFEPVWERDMNSHRHAMAAIAEAYKQLPHEYDGVFVNAEHFRKWLLIEEGYSTVEMDTFDTEQDARRSMIYIERLDRIRKDYSIIERRGAVIKVITARSMGVKEMKPREFQEAKWKIINRAAGMIGVSPDDLRGNAGRAA